MEAGATASGGAGGEEEQGPEGASNNILSSLPWVVLLSDVASRIDRHVVQRKPRNHVARTMPSDS